MGSCNKVWVRCIVGQGVLGVCRMVRRDLQSHSITRCASSAFSGVSFILLILALLQLKRGPYAAMQLFEVLRLRPPHIKCGLQLAGSESGCRCILLRCSRRVQMGDADIDDASVCPQKIFLRKEECLGSAVALP